MKFTDSGSIAAKIENIDQFYELTVTDTGIGFSAVERALHLFERQSFTRPLDSEALGIGLSEIKEILEFQGGSISAESSSAGSVVVLKIPKKFRVLTVVDKFGPPGFGYLSNSQVTDAPISDPATLQRRGLGVLVSAVIAVHYGILGMAETLLNSEGKAGPKKQIAVIERCAIRVIEVMSLIRDACLILESGVQLIPAMIDLGKLLEICEEETNRAIDKRGAPIKKKDVTFSNTTDKSLKLDPISHDGQRLYRLIIQLMENANKFTKEGEVSFGLEISQNPTRIIFNINDTGCGITPPLSSEILKPFFRINKDAYYGLGLGLGMVKSILAKSGGSIDFISEGRVCKVRVDLGQVGGEPVDISDISVAFPTDKRTDISAGLSSRPKTTRQGSYNQQSSILSENQTSPESAPSSIDPIHAAGPSTPTAQILIGLCDRSNDDTHAQSVPISASDHSKEVIKSPVSASASVPVKVDAIYDKKNSPPRLDIEQAYQSVWTDVTYSEAEPFSARFKDIEGTPRVESVPFAKSRCFGLFYEPKDGVTASLYESCVDVRENLNRIVALDSNIKEMLLRWDIQRDSLQ